MWIPGISSISLFRVRVTGLSLLSMTITPLLASTILMVIEYRKEILAEVFGARPGEVLPIAQGYLSR
jgi:hypothetical protein